MKPHDEVPAGRQGADLPKFAERLDGLAVSPMIALTNKAAELNRAGRNIISLSAGEPSFDTPVHIQEAAIAAIRKGDTHYTPIDGTRALKEAVVRKFKRENGLNFDLNQVSIGAGAKQVIFNAFAATLNYSDEVIVPTPYYPSYLEAIRVCGGRHVALASNAANDFRIDPDALEGAITDRTRWLIINAPSNPTGTSYSRSQLADIGRVLTRYPHIRILSDDIYEHLSFTGLPHATIAAVQPALAERVLTVNGVSKAYCMTGWRIGYAAGSAELIQAMAKVQSTVTTCPSSISQAAACAALDGPQSIIDDLACKFRDRRDQIVARLNAIDLLDCPVPKGSFYVFPSCQRLYGLKMPSGKEISNDADFAEYLMSEANVMVVPGHSFGTHGYFRASFVADEQSLDLACERIASACAGLR